MTRRTSTSPASSEGVIQFDLEFSLSPAPDEDSIAELNRWRRTLHRLGLIGLDPNRYGGVGYGNVSLRTGGNGFIVSGTQTGGKEQLDACDYCWVTDFDLNHNKIRATGPIKPSSEALTHGAIYAANPNTGCVIHVHSPQIWNCALVLGIPQTSSRITYGTPQMGIAAQENARGKDKGIIVMRGHEDGVIAFGRNVEETTTELLSWLTKTQASNKENE
ncbi:MAG: class II aldolase/adducin family protein [Methylococcaceae bacterium]|nr:class II aldolase/adducin family protein [Methylococcaceae bacterium]